MRYPGYKLFAVGFFVGLTGWMNGICFAEPVNQAVGEEVEMLVTLHEENQQLKSQISNLVTQVMMLELKPCGSKNSIRHKYGKAFW